MLLRSILRRATNTARISPLNQSPQLSLCRGLATKTKDKRPSPTKDPKNPKSRFDPKEKRHPEETQQLNDAESTFGEEKEIRRRQLAEDEKNPALDIGPNGRPLFTSAHSISSLTRDDINTYIKLSMEELKEVLPEGLPLGMLKEFEESGRSALLVRESFIDLRENFRRADDPSLVVNAKGARLFRTVC